ncbi:MAG: hypothetical protein FJZ59_01910 [Chlamydiae bacterium]|jgi:hypothetical protein|nr:hypothetical protein [Chlamydiota bacterium]
MQETMFLNEFCNRDSIFSPKEREGILFVIGRFDRAALHSEPGVNKPRLFFSIVPSDKENLREIEERILLYYPPSEKELYFCLQP